MRTFAWTRPLNSAWSTSLARSPIPAAATAVSIRCRPSWPWPAAPYMCGARGYTAIAQWAHDHDIELMHRLGFTRRPPKSGGIRKVLMAVSAPALEAALTRWAEALLGRIPVADEGPLDALALDGKSARGSFDGLSKAVHLLSLVAHRSGLTVAQAEVPSGGLDQTNEHKAALGLLSGLVLEGRLITGDAMFCQRRSEERRVGKEC